jgi:putative transposase
MPRPLRIEYEHAFYHVMNRGRAQQFIFHDTRHYQTFLTTLGEAQQRFNCVVHAYCLMGNHYHLLIETPEANLGRIMRHINGVYTQRYNRLNHTDGPLFRGRYKAILVEQDEYLLQLSRYIHRNPIEMKTPLVEQLEDYPWSSYPAFIGKAKAVNWLTREYTYQLLGYPHKYTHYRNFVMLGNDPDTEKFYGKDNWAVVLATDTFKQWVYEKLLPGLSEEVKSHVLKPGLTLAHVTAAVANYYGTTECTLRQIIKGPDKGNEGRKVAMYLCQEILDERLSSIASYFNLGHSGSVSFITHQIRTLRLNDETFSKKVEGIIKSIMKQVT